MKTIWNSGDRRELLERFSKLTPDRKPLWGKMSCTQMVTHCGEPLRAAMGELTVAAKGPVILRFPPVRYAVIHWLPVPKSAPTAPEFVPPPGGDWKRAQAALAQTTDRFVKMAEKGGTFVEHPAFGAISHAEWGLLMWKHLDHHLKQFGG